MKITALTCIAILLYPATTCLGTALPLPSIPQASAALDDAEIIRQYSIYIGLNSVAETHYAIRHHASRYLADPESMRQSVLAYLDKPMDSEKIDEELQHVYKLRKQKLLAEETERDKTFMQENAKRPGVVSLPIGIQYEVIPDPDGNNRRLEEMDCFIRSTTTGRQLDKKTSETALRFGDEPSKPPYFTHKLPNILQNTSALQNMPKGGEYIFYVPAALLSSSERKYLDNENAVIVYTFRQMRKDATSTGTLKRTLDELSQKYDELNAAGIARDILHRFQQIDAPDIDSKLAATTFRDHFDDKLDSASLQRDYQDIIRRYDILHTARQAERDKKHLEENARRPGVVALDNGIQYTVEKDPEGRNQPFTHAEITKRTSLVGDRVYFSGESMKKVPFQRIQSENKNAQVFNVNDQQLSVHAYGMPGMLGAAFDRIPDGCRWTFHIPLALLPEDARQDLQNTWKERCPAYIVHTCEVTENSALPSDKDGDIEDDAPGAPDEKQNFLWDKDRTAETMARDEAQFLRLNATMPNVTVLPNGVQYSYITDQDGHNGSIKSVSTMMPSTLAGDSFLSHIHLDLQNTRADGTRIYTHPLLEPYINDLPKAKQWFFCIPVDQLDPADKEWYEKRIGVRLNYILYILETENQP